MNRSEKGANASRANPIARRKTPIVNLRGVEGSLSRFDINNQNAENKGAKTKINKGFTD